MIRAGYNLSVLTKRDLNLIENMMDDNFEKLALIMKVGFDSLQEYMHEHFVTKEELYAMEGRYDQRFYEIDCRFDAVDASLRRLDGRVGNLELKMDSMSELYQNHENRILKLEDAVLD